ncbi:MAG: sigma-70 family RNA polymerase sigma factor [Myxococcota bacterium]|nr:sigma-70 family RNA polymerase sigma factor [Myxococcota bacterium]
MRDARTGNMRDARIGNPTSGDEPRPAATRDARTDNKTSDEPRPAATRDARTDNKTSDEPRPAAMRDARIGNKTSGTTEELAVVVGAARRGDRAAFAELYRRFARAVHGVVLTRVSYGDVPDVVQEVFAIALERLAQLAEPAAFPGWILSIARNRATDHCRGKRPTDELPDLPGPASRAAEVAEVLVALRALPETYQETLILRLVEGLTGPEIAEQTGLSPGSVRVNLHRGMKLLRERLGITAPEGGADERVG